MLRGTLLLFLLLNLTAYAQNTRIEAEDWQAEMNMDFADSASSPLKPSDRKEFTGLPFFPINEKFGVWAQLELTPESKPFKMKTSTDRLADYRQYAMASFTIDEDTFSLAVYQNLRLLKRPGYEDYLFIPFMDASNGSKSYSGGRYIEIHSVATDSLFINFNKAYNPYCAYNDRYSCPVPPSENYLDIAIEAGVLKPKKEH